LKAFTLEPVDRAALQAMRDAIVEELPEIELNTVADFLVAADGPESPCT
jgi:hypothetical protein